MLINFNFDTLKSKVTIHQAEEGGLWAEVPALSGCVISVPVLKNKDLKKRVSEKTNECCRH